MRSSRMTLAGIMAMAAVAVAQAPHLPPATYRNYFKPTGRRFNTPEIEAWNQAVEQRKAEKRARRGKWK